MSSEMSDKKVILWVIAGVVGAILFGIAWWAFTVATADVKGQGDAHKQKSSASNRIAKQEWFEEVYQDVLASDRKIDLFAKALARDPGDRTARTNYDGQISYCLDAAADYNAEARKQTSADFRAFDLPSEIDPTDPLTDCYPADSATE